MLIIFGCPLPIKSKERSPCVGISQLFVNYIYNWQALKKIIETGPCTQPNDGYLCNCHQNSPFGGSFQKLLFPELEKNCSFFSSGFCTLQKIRLNQANNKNICRYIYFYNHVLNLNVFTVKWMNYIYIPQQ